MPDSPQVGAPPSTPLKAGKMGSLFCFECLQLHQTSPSPLHNAAGATADRKNKMLHSHRSFQHVDKVANVMWFCCVSLLFFKGRGLRWRDDWGLRGSSGKSHAVTEGRPLVNCACFQKAAAPQVSHSLARREKGGKANVADLNMKIKFS